MGGVALPCARVIGHRPSLRIGHFDAGHIVASLAAPARQGVLVKGGVFIEQPAQVKALAFDKTRTLTRGKPVLVGVVPLDDHTAEELLERAVALEARSGHPLARAVNDYAAARGITVRPADDV